MTTDRPSSERIRPHDARLLDQWVFRDRESLEQRFGMEMDKLFALYESDQGRQKLIQRMRELDPSLNGNADRAAEIVRQNMEQLEQKKGFLEQVMALPGKGLEVAGKVGRTLWNHKILTLIALAIASWQLPNLIRALASIEGAEAGNALAKAAEYARSFLPFSVGKTGNIPDAVIATLPDSP